MTIDDLIVSSINMVEDQITNEQRYWDLRSELGPLRNDIESMGIEYIDHGNFFAEESIEIFEAIKRQYLNKKRKA